MGGASGDYAYVDRSFGGAVLYDADGTTTNIDLVGNENTFVLDASSEFDFFGYSYDPLYTDDSEVLFYKAALVVVARGRLSLVRQQMLQRTGTLSVLMALTQVSLLIYLK